MNDHRKCHLAPIFRHTDELPAEAEANLAPPEACWRGWATLRK
jgi:hypothetical protein